MRKNGAAQWKNARPCSRRPLNSRCATLSTWVSRCASCLSSTPLSHSAMRRCKRTSHARSAWTSTAWPGLARTASHRPTRGVHPGMIAIRTRPYAGRTRAAARRVSFRFRGAPRPRSSRTRRRAGCGAHPHPRAADPPSRQLRGRRARRRRTRALRRRRRFADECRHIPPTIAADDCSRRLQRRSQVQTRRLASSIYS